ncbi:hypothetical protein GCM10022378_00140 [Salinicoccus jeotgali]|uniref:TraD/TraG TraM recognition site domain-containing protein n=1 Tax=Salinicoccus jeotgali TaxID=381634 RepID=A0ABP7E470_9STAP
MRNQNNQYQRPQKSREEIEQGNQRFMEIALPLLLIIVVFLVLPLFVIALFMLIPLSLVGKKTRRLIALTSAIVFGYFIYKEPSQLFGYYGTLQANIGLDIQWINSILTAVFNEIPTANGFTYLLYVIGSIVVAFPLVEYKEYKKRLRVDTKEQEIDKFYDSDKYKKTKANRLKANEQLQKKWRKNPKDKMLVGINEHGNPMYMNFKELNQHAFVSATTGGGKTVLLMSFVEYAVMKNYPILFIDGKGSASTVNEFERINNDYGRDVTVFGDNYNVTYNPIKYGNSQVIVDKLRQLVETESVYYSNINDLLIQNLIMFIDDYGFKRDLKTFAYYLDSEKVKDVLNNDYEKKTVEVEVEEEDDDEVQEDDDNEFDLLDGIEEKPTKQKIKRTEKREVREKTERSKKFYERFFTNYADSKEGEEYLFIHGSSVRTEIIKITESDLGHLFEETENSVDLIDVSRNKKSVFVSFDGTIYEKFIEKTARFMILDINYLVSVRNKQLEDVGNDPFLAIYDEFAVYATEKIIDTVNKSREADFHCVISTQTIHDLTAIDSTFTDRILANTNTYFVGQVNEDTEVDKWTKTFGVYKDQEITTVTERGTKSKLNRKEERGDRGTARGVQRFLIEPQRLRNLSTGQFAVKRKASGIEAEPEIIYARNPLVK